MLNPITVVKQLKQLESDLATAEQDSRQKQARIERLEAAEKSDAESIAMYRKARDERDALQAKISDLMINVAFLDNLKKSYEELIEELQDERDALRVELETERMRLTACGVVALSNTPDSAKQARDIRSEYWSASCGDVARMVDENIKLRAKIEAMEQQEPIGVLHVGRQYGEELEDWEFEAFQSSCDRVNEAHANSPTSVRIYTRPIPPAPSVPTALLVAVADLVAQMEIISRVGFVDTPNDKDSCAAFCIAEGTWLELMSCVESLASALAATPEAKP